MQGFKASVPDEMIIAQILQGGTAKERCVQYLLKAHVGFMHKVRMKLGLSEEEAVFAYHDALTRLIEQVETGKFKGDSRLSSFFYSILYHKGIDSLRLRKKETMDSLSGIQDPGSSPLSAMEGLLLDEKMDHLRFHLKKMGDKCRQILLDWGYWGFSMKEIAERNDLKNEQTAKAMKHKCLTQLMRYIGEDGQSRDPG
jgi:RNA polymerase sigma-70 factor (ECF subfamily)